MTFFNTQPIECSASSYTLPHTTKHLPNPRALRPLVLSSVTNMEQGHDVTVSTSAFPSSGSSIQYYSRPIFPANDPIVPPSGVDPTSHRSYPGRYSNDSVEMHLFTDLNRLSYDSDLGTPSSASSSSSSSSTMLLTPMGGSQGGLTRIKEETMDGVSYRGLGADDSNDYDNAQIRQLPESTAWPPSGSEMFVESCISAYHTPLSIFGTRSSISPSTASDDDERMSSGWSEEDYDQSQEGNCEGQSQYHDRFLPEETTQQNNETLRPNTHLYPSQNSTHTPLNFISSPPHVSSAFAPPNATVSQHTSSRPPLPSSAPTSSVTNRPLKMHHPRPRRPFPVHFLSELPSDSEFLLSSLPKLSTHDALSPLPLLCQPAPASVLFPFSPDTASSMASTRQGTFFGSNSSFSSRNDSNTDIYPQTMSQDVLLCSCGCMASYVIG